MCAVVGWCNRERLRMSRCFWPFWSDSLETSMGFGVAEENIFWVCPDFALNCFAKVPNVRTAKNSAVHAECVFPIASNVYGRACLQDAFAAFINM